MTHFFWRPNPRNPPGLFVFLSQWKDVCGDISICKNTFAFCNAWMIYNNSVSMLNNATCIQQIPQRRLGYVCNMLAPRLQDFNTGILQVAYICATPQNNPPNFANDFTMTHLWTHETPQRCAVPPVTRLEAANFFKLVALAIYGIFTYMYHKNEKPSVGKYTLGVGPLPGCQ